MAGYDHTLIDTKWQEYWARENTFATPTDRTKPKYYVLDMFPYPSGDGLHVGHPKGYTATDVVARAKRMMGFNVLRVMGWDSFGLPAERRAERTGEHPSVITKRNIATFKSQLQKLGLSYDWSRELATSDPHYYKWTQWIFEVLFDRGLAYQSNVPVNFCPALGTVLANDEVHDGKYIEAGDPVEKRNLTQWMLRITDYAERLAKDREGLEWPAGTLQAQEAWIGRSVGANVVFELAAGGSITVFTTRPDTLFGGTYVVLAPALALVDQITTPAQRDAVAKYREEVGTRSVRDQPGQRQEDPGVGLRLRARELRHRRGVRVSRARRARLGVREEVQSADHRGRQGRQRAGSRVHRRWPAREQPVPRRAEQRAGEDEGHRVARGAQEGRVHRALQAARLAGLAAALLGRAVPGLLRQERRREPRPRGRAAGRAAADRRVQADARRPASARPRHRVAEVQGRHARDEHDAAVGRLVLVLPALPVAASRRRCVGSGRGEVLDAGRPLRRRQRACRAAPAVRAVLAQGAVRRRLRVDEGAVPAALPSGNDPQDVVPRSGDGQVPHRQRGRAARRRLVRQGHRQARRDQAR